MKKINNNTLTNIVGGGNCAAAVFSGIFGGAVVGARIGSYSKTLQGVGIGILAGAIIGGAAAGFTYC